MSKGTLSNDLLAGLTWALVILLLRGYDDIGSTVIEILRRYLEALQANAGKLILAGITPRLREQLRRTGMLALIGEENTFLLTETIGEAGNAALRAATDWLAESSTQERQDRLPVNRDEA